MWNFINLCSVTAETVTPREQQGQLICKEEPVSEQDQQTLTPCFPERTQFVPMRKSPQARPSVSTLHIIINLRGKEATAGMRVGIHKAKNTQ